MATEQTMPAAQAKLFTYDHTMALYREEIIFSEDSVDLKKTQMVLSEESWVTLMDRLSGYENDMDSENTLKSEFYSSYNIHKNGKILASIDAEGNYPEYGDNLTYMFVWEYAGNSTQIYGVFIDKAVVEYLDTISN